MTIEIYKKNKPSKDGSPRLRLIKDFLGDVYLVLVDDDGDVTSSGYICKISSEGLSLEHSFESESILSTSKGFVKVSK